MTKNEQDMLDRLADRIRYFRKNLGISQEKLAEKCDFDRTYISLLERGKRNPSYLNLEKLCIGLEVELSDLLRSCTE